MILYTTLFLGAIVVALMIRSFIFTIVAIAAGNKIDQGSEYNPDYAPKVTVLVPAHNEEGVILGCLECMHALTFKADQLEVIILNDRSQDKTKQIIDDFISQHPQTHIRAIHRPMNALPGKAAAMEEAIATLDSEIIVIFAADYLPVADLVWRLIAPFEDPQVGATMGRVVTYNGNSNSMTRIIDLERRSCYSIDLNVRNHLDLFPQFGGTTGAIRLSALKDAGGWDTSCLAEDNELTYRLYLKGYLIKYLNAAACYEETPELWQVRYKQVRRWAHGHTVCLFRYFIPVLMCKDKNIFRKMDALLLLTIYTAPAMFSLFSILSLIFLDASQTELLYPIQLLVLLSGIGNFVPFFQMYAACIKDGQPQCTRYIPYFFVSSNISLLASTHALFLVLVEKLRLKKTLAWDKTLRYRTTKVKP